MIKIICLLLLILFVSCKSKAVVVCPKTPTLHIFEDCHQLVNAQEFELRNNQICIKNTNTCYKNKNHIISILRQCVISYEKEIEILNSLAKIK